MFVQVMEGRVADADGVREHVATWMADLRPGAAGWLGTTAGLTADGSFVGVVRFESEEAAKANSARPEQGEWWESAKNAFEGDVSFTDCPEVDTFGGGGFDDAGFVQVIIGRGDRSVVAPAAAEIEEILRGMRPDVLGGVVAWPGDGTFVETVYFTSEGEARANESADPAPEHSEAMARLMSLMQFDRYIDISDPWFFGP